MQSGYSYGAPPPFQRPGSSAPLLPGRHFSQHAPLGPSAGTPPGLHSLNQSVGGPYQDSNAHAPQGQQYDTYLPPQQSPQSWQAPAVQSSAPPAGYVPSAAYNPNTYGPMPGSHQSPTIPRYDSSGSVGTSTVLPLGAPSHEQSVHSNHGQQYMHGVPPGGPLPPRPVMEAQSNTYQSQGVLSQSLFHPQEHYHKPPLPPRPASVAQNSQTQPSSIYSQAPAASQPYRINEPTHHFRPPDTGVPPSLGQNQQSSQSQFDYQTSSSNQHHAPPQRPPLPQGYQAEIEQIHQARPHQSLYSTLPPTHGYEPPNHPASSFTPQGWNLSDQNQQPNIIRNSSVPPPLPPPPPSAQDTSEQNIISPQMRTGSAFHSRLSKHYPSTETPLRADAVQQPPHVACGPPAIINQAVPSYPSSNTDPGTYNSAPTPPPSHNIAPPDRNYTPSSSHNGTGGLNQHSNPIQQSQQVYPCEPNYVQPAQHHFLGQLSTQGWNEPVDGYQQHPPKVLYGGPPQSSQETQSPSAHYEQSEPGKASQSEPCGLIDQQKWPNYSNQSLSQSQARTHVPSTNYTQYPDGTPGQYRPSETTGRVTENQTYYSHQNTEPKMEDIHIRQTPPLQVAPKRPILPQPILIDDSPTVDRGEQTPKPPASGAAASALGFGGPSDWEHFGVSDENEIDDTDMFSTKNKYPMALPASDTAELPSQPSPPLSVSQQGQSYRLESDAWPTPPAPLPLSLHQPKSDIGQRQNSIVSQEGSNQHAPTRLAEGQVAYKPLSRADSTISIDSGISGPDHRGSIDRTAEAWKQTPPSPPSRDGYQLGSNDLTTAGQHFVFEQGLSGTHESAATYPLSPSLHKHGEEGQQSRETGPASISQNDANITKSDITLQRDSKSLVCPSVPGLTSHPSQVPQASHQSAGHGRTGSSSASVGQSMGFDKPGNIMLQPEFDPYQHLEPWYRDSLDRYATALREEYQAASDEERTRIFTDFMMKESRLRGVRYGIGIGPRSEDGKGRSSPMHKSPGPVHDEDLGLEKFSVPAVISPPSLQRNATPLSTTGSYVVIDSLDEGQYSPGGRPKITRPPRDEELPCRRAESTISPTRSVTDNSTSLEFKTVKTDEQVLTDQDPKSPETPQITQMIEDPVYKPFRYAGAAMKEVEQNHKHTQSFDKLASPSTYKAYSVQSAPRQSSVDAGSSATYSSAAVVSPQRRGTSDGLSGRERMANSKEEHVEIFLEHVGKRPSSQGVHDDDLKKLNHHPTPETAKPALLPDNRETSTPVQGQDLIAQLQSILPSRDWTVHSDDDYSHSIKQSMDAILDDFTSTQHFFTNWEKKAKKLREHYDKDRRARQEEQEEHTNQLFDEKAIGYGDIAALEKEFKDSESTKKGQEDKEEYQIYVTDVFDPVYNRLQSEIQRLMELYVQCVNLMSRAVSDQSSVGFQTGRPELTRTMAVFLALCNKVELRHEKVLDAILNRDQKFKKTEIQPLYSAGNKSKMREMEKHFDSSEKRTKLDAAQQRVDRAIQLMNDIDETVLKAVEDNQDYVERLSQLIYKILDSTSGGASNTDPPVLEGEFAFARTVLETMITSSEALIQHFQTAASTVNDAKYQRSIAQSLLTHTDTNTFKKLDQDKQRKDEKLAQDLQNRLAIVRKDYRKAIERMDTVALKLTASGNGNTVGQRGSIDSTVDVEHRERIEKALEAAKQRNAAKFAESVT
ncbi:MAG: hypothetical protein M1827_000796 [Pycnora praestabilis]|nr:MAG: hypothetical protein M1827_000796 [Pycnora praestabilis]